jgi:hypothetical protein
MRPIRLREVSRARAARRMERQASQRHCMELLRDLPPITPGSMHELCRAIRTPDGRPIRVHPMRLPPHGPAALLGSSDDEHVIIVDETTSRWGRWRALAHEGAHAALGHGDEAISGPEQRALWFPDLDPAFVDRAMTFMRFSPAYYPTQQERDAEALGARLLAVVLRGMPNGTFNGESAPLPARRDALYRRFWLLRPLWVELVSAVPDAALFPPGPALADLVRVADLENRVVRQIIEILDVGRLTKDWQDPQVAAAARELARQAGLPEHHVEATGDAAMLADAARAVRRGTPPSPHGIACAASVDVHAELAWLGLVASAFTGPIVSRHLR